MALASAAGNTAEGMGGAAEAPPPARDSDARRASSGWAWGGCSSAEGSAQVSMPQVELAVPRTVQMMGVAPSGIPKGLRDWCR